MQNFDAHPIYNTESNVTLNDDSHVRNNGPNDCGGDGTGTYSGNSCG